MEESSELVDSAPEVTADEEEASLICEEVDLREVLSTEVEIKEEEVELDEGTFLPADDTPDPIGGDTVRDDGDSETGASTASADEAVRKDALNFLSRKRRGKRCGSSTESADEGGRKQKEVNSKKRGAKPASTVNRKRKRRIPKFDGLAMPRFVPGMMVQRNKKHLCLECGQQFDSIFRFATHTKRWHMAALPRYPHGCFYCPRMFRGRKALHRHLLIHSRLEPLRCPICRGTYHSAFGMANHLAVHNAEAQTVQKKPEVVKNSKSLIYSKNVSLLDNVCFACGATEVSEDDLKTHINAHQGMLQCKACYEMVPTAAELLDHVDTVHNNQAELTYYCCPLQHCNRSFLSAADMRKHSQSCVPPPAKPKPTSGPYSGTRMACDICGLIYYELDHFVTHMRLHGTLSREISGTGHCKLCAFVGKSPGEQALHMVQQHGYRDRLASLVGKLNIVPPKEKRG